MRLSIPVPRSAAAVRGNYGIEGSAVVCAPGVQGRAEGGAVMVPLSAVAGPSLRSAVAVEARALVHAGEGEFPEATPLRKRRDSWHKIGLRVAGNMSFPRSRPASSRSRASHMMMRDPEDKNVLRVESRPEGR